MGAKLTETLNQKSTLTMVFPEIMEKCATDGKFRKGLNFMHDACRGLQSLASTSS